MVNAVPVRIDEILDFAAFAGDTGRVVRFIEFMARLFRQAVWAKLPGHGINSRDSFARPAPCR